MAPGAKGRHGECETGFPTLTKHALTLVSPPILPVADTRTTTHCLEGHDGASDVGVVLRVV